MRVAIHYCVHCGAKYYFQLSGTVTAVDTPAEYRDKDYCPECKKAIVDALSKISIKSKMKWIETTDLSLTELQEIEKSKQRLYEQETAGDQLVFPRLRRVFPEMFNTELNEFSITSEVEVNRIKYRYSYFPSLRSEAKITKLARVDLETNEIIAAY